MIDEATLRNMNNGELINVTLYDGHPVIEELARRLEEADNELLTHGELFQKMGALEDLVETLSDVQEELDGIEVSDDDEKDYMHQISTLRDTLERLEQVYNEVMEVAE